MSWEETKEEGKGFVSTIMTYGPSALLSTRAGAQTVDGVMRGDAFATMGGGLFVVAALLLGGKDFKKALQEQKIELAETIDKIYDEVNDLDPRFFNEKDEQDAGSSHQFASSLMAISRLGL